MISAMSAYCLLTWLTSLSTAHGESVLVIIMNHFSLMIRGSLAELTAPDPTLGRVVCGTNIAQSGTCLAGYSLWLCWSQSSAVDRSATYLVTSDI